MGYAEYFTLGLFIGLGFGACFGLVIFALLSAGHSADEHIRVLRGE